ncbi:MAG: hypothetical protein U0350_24935 [Caldilineaceae bacterium]
MLPNESRPDFSLFFQIIQTLEAIEAPYMVIGAFAAALHGITRTTYDVDMIVNLNSQHIAALVQAFPPPRYYADPVQMRESIRTGTMFNIIDTSRGEKADLIPLTMEVRYYWAFQHRERQTVDVYGLVPFQIWCARREEIIVGKLMAWQEGDHANTKLTVTRCLFFTTCILIMFKNPSWTKHTLTNKRTH